MFSGSCEVFLWSRMFSICALLLLMSRTNAELQTPAANDVADARLVNGDRRCSGHLEIKHQSQWRTLRLKSNVEVESARSAFAEISCRQMDCGSVISLKVHAATEPKPAWEVYFPCSGKESTIQECKDAASHKKVDDIESSVTSTFVQCSDFLRLTNIYSHTPCIGIVTVKSGQNWVHVCETKMPKDEELMLTKMCAELDCGPIATHQYLIPHKAVESTIIQCHGNETQLEQCPAAAHSGCEWVLRITCGDSYSMRAVGESRCRGVLEGKKGVEWRPMMHGWTKMQDYQLMYLCEVMGCGTIVSSSAKYFHHKQRVWWMDERCRARIFCSRYVDIEDHNGLEIVCTEAVRLVRTKISCSGFLEVQYEGKWQKLCHKDFSPQPFVACRDLGCGFPREVHSTSRDDMHNALSLNCSGQEEHLMDCPESPLPAEGANDPCTMAFVACQSTPTAPAITVFSRLADGPPKALHVYDGHLIFITCSIRSPIPVKSFLLTFVSQNMTVVKGNQSAVDNSAQFVFEAELNQDGFYNCSYNYEFSLDVFSEPTTFYLDVKESRYARLSGRESGCLGRLELEHEGQWRPVSQQHWGLKEASVVCRQLHCGSAISTDTQSGELQPVWRFYSDCDGSERALLDCGSVRKWMSSTTVHMLCSDIVAPPNITVLADRLYPENTEQVVVHEGHSFFVNCSVEPRFPGGRLSLVFSGSKKLSLNEAVSDYWSVFTFSNVRKDQSGNYSCVYHNTVSQHNFTFQSKTVTITVQESADIKLDDGLQRDDGSRSCSGTLFMTKMKMKMVTVETSSWDMRHASIVCRQLGCGNAVSTSKLQLPTFTSTWRFFSDCDGSEATLLHCGHIEEWFSSTAVQVVCAGNN